MRVTTFHCLLIAGFAASLPVVVTAHPTDFVTEPSAKQMAKLQSMTPESVAAAIATTDDALAVVATLDTFKAYFSRGAFTDRTRSDAFFRALMDKKTGVVVFQLYQTLSYTGEARHFKIANYASSAGVQSAPVIYISTEIPTCTYGLCSFTDDVSVLIPESELREIAAAYRQGSSVPWRYKLRAANGIDWEDRFMPAEAAGLLLAVERYKAGLPPQTVR